MALQGLSKNQRAVFLISCMKETFRIILMIAMSSIITAAENFMVYKKWHHIEVSKNLLVNISLAVLHTLDGFASLHELALTPSKKLRTYE